MTTKDSDVHEMEDPEGELEKALIAEFLQNRGLDLHAVLADQLALQTITLHHEHALHGGTPA
jgi:hypothetical protein